MKIPPKHIQGNDRIFKTEFPNESSRSMNYEYDMPNTNDITSINKRKRNSISGHNKKSNNKNGTTLKVKQEKIYKCDKNIKNCAHHHSNPVKVIKVEDTDELPSIVTMKGIRRPVKKHRPLSVAVKDVRNPRRSKNEFKEAQEDSDFSHHYSESIELNPNDIFSSSYENTNKKK